MEENQNVFTGNVNPDLGYGSQDIVNADLGDEVLGVDAGVANTVQDNFIGYANVQPEYATVTQSVDNVVYTGEQPAQVQPAQVQEAQMQPAQVQEAPVQAQAKPQEKLPELDPNVVRIIVKLSDLKSAIKKADIIAGKNELKPVTEIIECKVVNQLLTMRSTDRDNIITINVPTVEATEGAAMTLKVYEFRPLVDKLSSEFVTFTIEGNVVTVLAGKGEYKYNQATDLTTNQVIVIPNIDEGLVPIESTVEVKSEILTKPIEAVLPLVSGMDDDIMYSTVYLGDKVISSNGSEVAASNVNVASMIHDSVFLKSSMASKLLSIGTGDTLNIGFGELSGRKVMCIYTDNYKLFSLLKDGEEDYPINEVNEFIDAPVGDYIRVSRAGLLETLGRLATFFTSVTRGFLGVEKVGNTEIQISNEKNAKEGVSITGNGNISIKFDAARLQIVLKSITTDDVIIEPIIQDDLPVTNVKVSSSDKNVVFVIGTVI